MWKKVNVVFKLKSPLHIGYMPFKGSVVSPTRYYVPGKNLWGALTKRITEYSGENPAAKNYIDIGGKIMENFRFSYFYIYDGKTIYLPCYTDEGLEYGGMEKSEFEHRFIGSRVSTGIDDTSGTAKDRSLHEIEFINNRFKDEKGNIKDVKIIGCIWVKKDVKIENKNIIINDRGIFIDTFNIAEELTLGGESKYGFGSVLIDSIDKIEFPFALIKDDETVEISEDKPILAHLKYDKNVKFSGDIELLTGRGYFDPNNSDKSKENATDKPGKIISKPEYYFTPGTKLLKKTSAKMNWNGTLKP